MEGFWKWLMRANARGVFISSVAALILVTGWWTWREFFFVGSDRGVLSGSGRREERRGLGLLSVMEDMTKAGVHVAADDPFLNPWATGREPSRPQRTWQRRRRRTARVPDVNTATRKSDTVSLTYKGIFKRSDGKEMALIGDSKSGDSSFYGIGDELHQVVVGKMGVEELEITTGDGSTVVLTIGVPGVFEEGKHVE
jgi:hypothetical protein